MKISLEISMYPLDKEYGPLILDFIQRLRSYPDLTIKSNSMSSQIFGNYDDIFNILKKEMKISFLEGKDMMMVMKMANMDLE